MAEYTGWKPALTAALSKVGETIAVEQITLTAPLAYTLPTGRPSGVVHSTVFTQDNTGGHTVTYGGAPVTVALTAGASTTVELHPVGAGYVVRYPAGINTDDVEKLRATLGIATTTDIAAASVVSRMKARPTRARISAIHSLIGSLIDSGVWGKLDGLYLLAAHTQQAGQLNWVGCAQDLTAVNAPTFVTDRGFSGDGATSYFDTNALATNMEMYSPDDASMGVYVRTNGAGVEMSAGYSAYLENNLYGNAVIRANNSSSSISLANGGNTGLFAWSRDAASVIAYRAGVPIGSSAQPAGYVAASNVLLLRAAGGSYSSAQISAAFFGGTLTANQHALTNDAIGIYLAALGAV